MTKFSRLWILLLALLLIPAVQLVGCKAETDDDGAQIEVGDPD